MSASHRILLSRRAYDLGFFEALTPPEFVLSCVEDLDHTALADALRNAEFLFLYPQASWLEMAPKLRVLQLPGVGYTDDLIVAARKRGVPVTVTPEGTCLGVAEGTIMLILALYRNLPRAHQGMREGRWPHEELRGQSYFLYDKVLGIVGLGRIGLEVVQRARGFLPRRIVYHDLYRRPPEEEKALGVEYLELDELLRASDIVSLHVFLSDRSRHMIGARELALMKPNAILINTARGAVVDEAALYQALRDHTIWGAGIDAWTEEPTPPDNPIRRLDNVVCTPHMATGTVDADRIKYEAGIANFQRALRGEPLENVVRRLNSEM